MLTVSTVSPSEADVAASVLGASVPHHIGYEVYLRGRLFASRQPMAQPMPDDWPDPPVEVR